MVDEAHEYCGHVSASQLTTFIDCERKWAFKYVFGQRPPETEPMRFGSVYHLLAELCNTEGLSYVKLKRFAKGELTFQDDPRLPEPDFTDGQPDPGRQQRAGQLIKAAWDQGYVGPALRDTMSSEMNYLAETDVQTLEMAGFPVVGYIDLTYEGPDGLYVKDYKGTSSWKWAVDQRSMRKNVQLIVYAQEMLNRCPSYDEVTIGQIQMHKEKLGHIRDVEVTLDRDYVQERFDKLRPYAQRMAEIVEESQLDKTEPNYDACSKYGGCPFIDTCSGVGYDDQSDPFSDFGGGPQSDSSTGDQTMKLSDLKQNANSSDNNDSSSDDSEDNPFGGGGLSFGNSTEPPKDDTPDLDADDGDDSEDEVHSVTIYGQDVDVHDHDDPAASAKKLEQFNDRLHEMALDSDISPAEYDYSLISEMTIQRRTPDGLVELVKEEMGVEEDDGEESAPDNPGLEPPEAPEAQQPKSMSDKTLHDWDITQCGGVGAKGAQKTYDKLEDGQDTDLETFASKDFSEFPGIGEKTAKNIEQQLADVLKFHGDLPEDANIEDGDDDGPKDPVEAAFEDWRAIYEGEAEGTFNLLEYGLDDTQADEVRDKMDSYRKVDDQFEAEEQEGVQDSGGSEDSVLLVDCAPLKYNGRPTVLIDDLLAPLKEKVAEQLGVSLYSVPDYREGEKQLAGQVLANLDQFKGKVLVADSRSDYSKSVLEALRPNMDVVVQG